MRAIAVDWSGAARPESVIWLGLVRDGRLERLENGRHRDAIARFVVAEARADPEVVVGLDFAFGLPAWYSAQHGIADARALWEHLDARADELIRDPSAPFWGRAGKAASGLTRERELRVTDRDHPPAKSVFQLVGAGQVGSGTLRGMALLLRLADEGFAIWPFEDACPPVAIEIYPRALIGEVVRKDPAERRAWLARFPEMGERERTLAAGNEHAFDAAVSAVVLWRHRQQIAALRRDPGVQLEGRIWAPRAVLGAD